MQLKLAGIGIIGFCLIPTITILLDQNALWNFKMNAHFPTGVNPALEILKNSVIRTTPHSVKNLTVMSKLSMPSVSPLNDSQKLSTAGSNSGYSIFCFYLTAGETQNFSIEAYQLSTIIFKMFTFIFIGRINLLCEWIQIKDFAFPSTKGD